VSFLYPAFLAAALAVAIPIALHLFRRKTETVIEFPAVRLLEKVPVERQRRRRLRELILLALRVTALALLAVAFARPYFDRATAAMPAPVTLIALDTSMSLSAPGQLDAARHAAKQVVERTPPTHRIAFATFADSASIVVPPTTDRGAVAAAIDAASIGAGGTRFRTALARAGEVIDGDGGRIVVVTDLQASGWDAADEGAVEDGIQVEVAEIQPPAGNAAITAVRREGRGVAVGVHNFGMSPIRVPIRLRLGDRDVATDTVEVASQAAAEARLTAVLPPRGAAEVTIEDPTGYQFDNTRYFVLDPPGAIPILVITAAPPGSSNAGIYIERALAVADDGRAFKGTVIDGRAFSMMTAEQFGQPGALIVLGTTSLDRAGRERVAQYLEGGGRGLVTLGPDVDLDTLSDTVGVEVEIDRDDADTTERTVTLVAVDGRHPIFRPFLNPTGALGDVYVERYRRLNDQSGRAVLARFSGAGIALTEQTVGRGRLLLFASDLENQWNRFPLNPAFVPWAIETARYLTQGREHRQSFTIPDVPSGAKPAPGVYETPAGRVSVNPDVRESNPARTSVEEFKGAIARLNRSADIQARVESRQQEERQRLWQIGLIVMFLALAGEGLIGRKAA
jgi:aerotolerance regulator-like protein/VWA domain-containing protein